MSDSPAKNSQLSLNPLGAGDLIDRAVRFYRKNFWVFILISSPPIVVGTIFLVGWTALASSLFTLSSSNPGEATVYQIFLSLGGFLIWTIQTIATLVVMGGASRNFVRHLLFDEPITFRETYKNVKSRLGGLIGASTLLGFLIGFFGIVVFYFGLAVTAVVIVFIAWALSFFPLLAFVVCAAFAIALGYGTIWLFFLVVSRFVYVPQVMLVEGQSVFSAIGRSTSLAGKNVNRVAALFIFTIVATYSALFLLYIPIGWYAWLSGINLQDLFVADTIPAWYTVANQVVGQMSFILLTPIWMIGLCLLYVDERVRSEGYDIELMAAKRLGEIPSVPQTYVNPLHPALSKQALQTESPGSPNPKNQTTKKSSSSTLGLD